MTFYISLLLLCVFSSWCGPFCYWSPFMLICPFLLCVIDFIPFSLSVYNWFWYVQHLSLSTRKIPKEMKNFVHLVQKYVKSPLIILAPPPHKSAKSKFSVSQLLLFRLLQCSVGAFSGLTTAGRPPPRQPRHQKRFYVLPYPYLAHSVATSPALGKYFKD